MSSKKEERVLRVLEKTADQMDEVAAGIKEAEAMRAVLAAPALSEPEDGPLKEDQDPYAASPANGETYSVICPGCGQLVPSEYDSFVSRAAADAYAREHCDCNKQPSEELPPVYLGTCRYCGQSRSVMGCRYQMEADEQATRSCRCSGSESYRDKLAAEERRREALREVEDNLQTLFPGAGQEQMEIMRLAATAIYDRQLVSISLKLTWTVSAKISRNSKGNIVIEQKEASAQKAEV